MGTKSALLRNLIFFVPKNGAKRTGIHQFFFSLRFFRIDEDNTIRSLFDGSSCVSLHAGSLVLTMLTGDRKIGHQYSWELSSFFFLNTHPEMAREGLCF